MAPRIGGRKINLARTKCLICGHRRDNVNLGELYDVQVFAVHYLCLLTGRHLYPIANPRSREGLLGFRLTDIYRAYRHYISKICVYCNSSGASLECNSCGIRYHLPCGRRRGVVVEMSGAFMSYCRRCHLRLFPSVINDLDSKSCVVCYKENFGKRYDRPYWPACCRSCNYCLCFDCVKKYAHVSGYRMKCPICSEWDKFRADVRTFGIFIPDTEAQWLTQTSCTCVRSPLVCGAIRCLITANATICNTLVACLICDNQISHFEYVSRTKDPPTKLLDCFPWLRPVLKSSICAQLKSRILTAVKAHWEMYSGRVYYHDILDAECINGLVASLKARSIGVRVDVSEPNNGNPQEGVAGPSSRM